MLVGSLQSVSRTQRLHFLKQQSNVSKKKKTANVSDHKSTTFRVLKGKGKVMSTGLDSEVATGWTVRESNPGGGEIFLTHSNRPWGLPSLLYNGYQVFQGGKTAKA